MKRGASLRESHPITGVLEIRDALRLRELTLPRDGFYVHMGKRLLDLVLVVPLLVLAMPIILLTAAAVVASSGWPAFYRGKRVGKDGHEFTIWKLRTMRQDAESILDEWLKDPRIAADFFKGFKLREDARITRVGAFLRRTSLDELPQLLNVVRGEMSLVGHRPIVREELMHHQAHLPDFLAMKPGITGIWQVGGRNDISYPERADVELSYASSCSLRFDLLILLRTLVAPLRFNGR